jgi:hypothetical protein
LNLIKTELLAVKDSEQMHEVLIRLYQSFGFRIVREVGDEQSSVTIGDRLTWGAVGTLMEMDISNFMKEWKPKLNTFLRLALIKRDMADADSNKYKYTSSGMKRSVVALTRERGANDKLMNLLVSKSKGLSNENENEDKNKDNLECIEIPCIQFGPGPDLPALTSALRETDLVVITSPQAAHVFLEALSSAGLPPSSIRVASVGKGTSAPLKDKGVIPVFEPSDSTAKTLAVELPDTWGLNVLYVFKED